MTKISEEYLTFCAPATCYCLPTRYRKLLIRLKSIVTVEKKQFKELIQIIKQARHKAI